MGWATYTHGSNQVVQPLLPLLNKVLLEQSYVHLIMYFLDAFLLQLWSAKTKLFLSSPFRKIATLS